MTEQQAIKAIQNDLEWHSKELKPAYKEVLKMAIQALENQKNMWQMLEDLKRYSAIGTIEECRTAVERMKNIQSVIESVRETCYQMGLDESQAEILTDGIKEKLDWSE